ncbi:hypothetical protein OUZ56_021102 [Daphnia magna]|uniref:Uncharacterized protein n=1 Tax=Daphnia magna TaxID=35525 RepID=A0ABQ9ZGE7_9CRUS|nr:hypothetical protein OUZ56_021102 [Daphnia magna]
MQDGKCCPAKIPSISDRLQLLFENPLHIQELIFKEKCQPVRQAIDLTYTSDQPVQNHVIENQYKTVRIESRDAYATLLQDWEGAPPVVIEVFNSPFTFDHGSRYGILVYDVIVRGWELVGCLSPLISDNPDTRQVPDPTIRLMEYFRKNLHNLTDVTNFTKKRKSLEENVGRRHCTNLPVANFQFQPTTNSQSF